MNRYEASIYFSGSFHFLVPHLEVDECLPGLFFRFPRHPSREDLSTVDDIAQNFFHVSILIPQLIDSGQQSDCPVKDIPGVIHLTILHLHLCILYPNGYDFGIDIESSFEDRPGSFQFLLRFFPMSILEPVRDL